MWTGQSDKCFSKPTLNGYFILVNMGSYRIVTVGINTAYQYDPSKLCG